MQEYDLILKNGTCVFPDKTELLDLAIKNGKIAKINSEINSQSKEVIDCTNLHILPGLIDGHVHFREPGLCHKEDLYTGSLSAVHGGVTSFLEMPNTKPLTITKEALQEKVFLSKQKSLSNFAFFIGATDNNLQELINAHLIPGCCGIKVFLGSSTGKLLLYNDQKLLEILENTSMPISFHAEDEMLLNQRLPIQQAATSVHDHIKWRNIDTAIQATKKIINLAKQAKRKINLLHISTKEEIDFLRENKQYCNVEVTPQHLSLSSPNCYNDLKNLAQMNPPIREQVHQDALWDGIEDGVVDFIASDHAPHTISEKANNYPDSPSGIPGVQTTLSIMLDHAARERISLPNLTSLLSFNPAKIYQLKNKGLLNVGFDADIAIVDTKKKYIISNDQIQSKCSYTPFNGQELTGKNIFTIIAGNIIVKNDQLMNNIPGTTLEMDRS